MSSTQAPEREGNQLGYCYECDRQVQINSQDFTCSSCGNGFIEILDEAQINE